MRAVFVCENDYWIGQVFDREARKAIGNVAKLDETVYHKSDLLGSPEWFADVEIIFSTWGMPQLTEEEIHLCLPRL